jgi:hypothetical protein
VSAPFPPYCKWLKPSLTLKPGTEYEFFKTKHWELSIQRISEQGYVETRINESKNHRGFNWTAQAGLLIGVAGVGPLIETLIAQHKSPPFSFLRETANESTPQSETVLSVSDKAAGFLHRYFPGSPPHQPQNGLESI